MDILSIFVGSFVTAVLIAVIWQVSKRMALSMMRRQANYRGREVQKEMADRLQEFYEKMAVAWQKKPEGHGPKEFMLQDGGLGICIEHLDILMRYGVRMIKMLSKNSGIDEGAAGELLGGLISGKQE